jgi:hypothetical protein
VLAHFRATFIKWRYETLALAVSELLRLEHICKEMKEFHLPAVQDKESLKKAMHAAHDPALWRWMHGPGKHVVLQVDLARHWFMVCGCPDHKQQRHDTGTQDPCCLKGRRLDEVEHFVTTEPARIRQAATDLIPTDVGGDAATCRETKELLRKYASMFETRTKYFLIIPWYYIKMDTPEGARKCLQQFADAEYNSLDPLSKRLGTELKHDMEIVAANGPVSQAIRREKRRLENASCDEGPGEGYHRGATHYSARAPGATMQTIVQEIRLDDGLEVVRELVAKHGAKARDIIRWEWRNYKRILQTSSRKAHRGVDLSAKAVYARVYRQDDRARNNWTIVVDPVRADAVLPFEDNVDAVQREYVRSVFNPGTYYEMERRRAPPSAAITDGVVDEGLEPGPGQRSARQVFQVVERHHGSSRPKLMHTILSFADPTLHAKIALLVQPMEVRTVSEDGGVLSVFPTGVPSWVDHSSLGSFDDICYRLFRFAAVDQDETDLVCCILKDRCAARPLMPITDEACPVLSILWYLQSQGWKYASRKMVHTPANVGTLICDGRTPIRHKLYFMVLCRLRDRLRQSSSIPSDQSQLYYRILLLGKHVEPYLSKDLYEAMLGGKSNIAALPAPEDDEPAPVLAPVPPGELDDEVLVGVTEGEPPPKRKYTPPSSNPLPCVDEREPRRRRNQPPPRPLEDPPPAIPAPPTPPAPGRPGSSGDPGPGPAGPPVVDPGSDDDIVVAAVEGPPRVEDPGRIPVQGARTADAIGGGVLRWEMYTPPKGKPYPNYQINCLTCGGKRNCKKTKGSTAVNSARHGRLEALAFVHAWRTTAIRRPDKSHQWHDPTDAEVDAFVGEHREDLERLLVKVMDDA